MAWGEHGVGHALRRRVRHRPERVDERVPVLAQWPEHLLPCVKRTRIDTAKTDDGREVQAARRFGILGKVEQQRPVRELLGQRA